MCTVTLNHPFESVILCFHSSGNLTIVLTTYLSRSFVVNYLWLIFLDRLNERVTEGAAFDPHDFNF